MTTNDDFLTFANKWLDRFADDTMTGYDLADNIEFADDCTAMGFDMDDCTAIREKYGVTSYDDIEASLSRIDDPYALGSTMFSYWRYFNHWAYSASDILTHRTWFINVLNRLIELI